MLAAGDAEVAVAVKAMDTQPVVYAGRDAGGWPRLHATSEENVLVGITAILTIRGRKNSFHLVSQC